jgi:hypothetical protein
MLSRYLILSLFILVFAACDDEQALPALDDVAAPSELSLKLVMAVESPGQLTITPGGRGVTLFTVDFGDGSDSEELQVGEAAEHQYAQGNYTLGLIGMGINGKTTTFSQDIVVAATPPRNLAVNIGPTAGNPLSINVSATAEFASGFAAYFGETADETPTPIATGQTISYAYAAPGDYDVRVVALSEGMETNLEFTQTVTITDGSTAVSLPLDFENTNTTYAWAGFGGATPELIDNPDVSENNGSARVVQLNKGSGSEVWAGTALLLDSPVDFSVSDKIYVNVWSPRASVPILLKVETAASADVFVEVIANTTVANAWEQVEFDFSAAGDLSIDYRNMVIFFDFGTAGMNENFYFDDISLSSDGGGGGGGAVIDLPLDFQNAEATYTFGAFGRCGIEVLDNPDASGINTSSRVAGLTRDNGSEVWAGVFIDVDEAIDFSGGQSVRLKVWSPVAGANVGLKLENPDNPNQFVEVYVPTTGANAWEELVYDMSGIEALPNIRRIVIIGNNTAPGSGETYYFDDIRL